MERLTYRGANGKAYVSCGYHGSDSTEHKRAIVADRLAAYEETGLEPEEITTEPPFCVFYCNRRCNLDGDWCAEGPGCQKEMDKNQIAHLRDLLAAEQDGRLVVLPCKVGDTVWTNFAMSGWYFRDKDKPYEAKVVFVGLNSSEEMGGGLFNVVYRKRELMMQFRFSDIGKTVFLTRAEAEAALRGEEHG